MEHTQTRDETCHLRQESMLPLAEGGVVRRVTDETLLVASFDSRRLSFVAIGFWKKAHHENHIRRARLRREQMQEDLCTLSETGAVIT